LTVLDKNKSLTHECGCGCIDCACGKRNRFFRGKRMKADDFLVEQLYSIERRRIINRSVIGTGVVNGFEMHTGASDVGPGFALDEHGREIVLAHTTKLGPKNVFLVAPGASGCRVQRLDEVEAEKLYLLSIHYAERRYGQAALPDSCGCEKPEQNYVCETGVFSLTEIGEPCPCGEHPCDWHCDCLTTDACGAPPPYAPGDPDIYQKSPEQHAKQGSLDEAFEHLQKTGEVPPPAHFEAVPKDQFIPHNNRGGRGPHACLCHRLMKDPVDCSHPGLCTWNGYDIDPAHGVALACVEVTKTDDECDPVHIVVKDPCGPRDFVKSNDLLYDFIRGCDLTHISWVSWHWWHRRLELMPWPMFAQLFHLNQNNKNDPDNGKTAFVIRFSAPVFTSTIRYDSMVMRVITIEQPTDWRLIRRIPIVRFDYASHASGLPDGTTDQIRVVVSPDWIDDEIQGTSSWLTTNGFEVEVEFNGFGVLDCHHQPVSADTIGLEAFPTGNGSPGGIYRSAFRVHAKPHKPKYA
jgi:hypothetical protein